MAMPVMAKYKNMPVFALLLFPQQLLYRVTAQNHEILTLPTASSAKSPFFLPFS